MKLKVYNSAEEIWQAVTEQLAESMKKRPASPFHIALSGASTAQKMFHAWATTYREKIHWDQLRFYWVDERCVGPEDEESNFKHAEDLLFRPLNIPSSHVHRIFGEREPDVEAERYSEVVKWELPGCASCPCFDCIFLGIGEDGHTASIFPDYSALLTDQHCYAVSRHPEGQQRITMTGTLILKSKMILIPVVGASKTAILQKVLHSSNPALPAAYILSHAPQATVFTDSKISLE